MKTNNYAQKYQQALQAGEKRDYITAVKLLTDVITNTDEFPHALLYLGRSYHALGEFDKAVQFLNFYLRIMPDSEPGHFFLARTYLKKEYYKRAIHHLKIVIERNPRFFPAFSFLGLGYLKIRRPEKAIAYFQKALELEPQDRRAFTGYLSALMLKGIKSFNRQQYEEARQIFTFIAKHKDNNVLIHLYLARIYRELKDYRQALRHYEVAGRLAPQDTVLPLFKAVILLQMGEREAAWEVLKQHPPYFEALQKNLNVANDPELLSKFTTFTLFKEKRFREVISHAKKILRQNYRDIDMHALVADSYYHLGEMDKAKNHYQRCLDLDKNRLEYLQGLALALWELQSYQELLQVARHIQRVAPADKTASYFYALCYSVLGDSQEEAITQLQQEIKKHGPDLHLMFALGKTYLRNDLPELSESWFNRVLKLDEQHTEALQLLLKTLQLQNKKTEAKSVYGRYLDLFPDDARKRGEFVQLLLDIEDYKTAGGELVKLLAREPGNRELKKNLAFCYLKTKKYHDSILIYRDLLRENPTSVPLLRTLIVCLVKNGNTKTAINLLEKAVLFMKDNPALLLPLGVLYSQEENYEKANSTFRAVLSINPRDWRAYHNLSVLYKRMGQCDLAERFLQRAREYSPKA